VQADSGRRGPPFVGNPMNGPLPLGLSMTQSIVTLLERLGGFMCRSFRNHRLRSFGPHENRSSLPADLSGFFERGV
jgi:hypothetical protein